MYSPEKIDIPAFLVDKDFREGILPQIARGRSFSCLDVVGVGSGTR